MPVIQTIGDANGMTVACNRCGQHPQTLIEQYMVCGCQDAILEAQSSTSAMVISVPIQLRNHFVQLATLARACQELRRYIPGQAGVVPV